MSKSHVGSAGILGGIQWKCINDGWDVGVHCSSSEPRYFTAAPCGDITVLLQSTFSETSIQQHSLMLLWAVSEWPSCGAGAARFLMLMQVWHQQWDQSRAGYLETRLPRLTHTHSLTHSLWAHTLVQALSLWHTLTHTMRTCAELLYDPELDFTFQTD